MGYFKFLVVAFFGCFLLTISNAFVLNPLTATNAANNKGVLLEMVAKPSEKAALLKQMEDRMSELEEKIFKSSVAQQYADTQIEQLQAELKDTKSQKDEFMTRSLELTSQVSRLEAALEAE
eukprot:CAMPEP_0194579802 /NCGR_PEP_ID=MMETSP0292-20121207/13771_1 /TAXON_ID=39354 /ORGANISM="Heterosigma akashiwo, Strain CCMP2393" /LENGTH=120 /DNA_ID=CAMNT_0039432923 /DNA_START=97 /DNA_END=456 /DNA_ORIENTATION=+